MKYIFPSVVSPHSILKGKLSSFPPQLWLCSSFSVWIVKFFLLENLDFPLLDWELGYGHLGFLGLEYYQVSATQ